MGLYLASTPSTKTAGKQEVYRELHLGDGVMLPAGLLPVLYKSVIQHHMSPRNLLCLLGIWPELGSRANQELPRLKLDQYTKLINGTKKKHSPSLM